MPPSNDLPNPSPNSPQSVTFAAQVMSGPIPSAQELARYEEICPGFADRIITRYERQSEHRMQLELIVVKGDNMRATWGLVTGFLIGLAGIAGGTECAIHGAQIAGSVLGGGTITALVSVFVRGSQERKAERIEKAKIMTGQD